MTEILSEAEIEEGLQELIDINSENIEGTPKSCASMEGYVFERSVLTSSLNTIKLQRQQLAEIKKINGTHGGNHWRGSHWAQQRINELCESLLKPESEASGD